jgi:hypothetical protein
MLEEWRSGDGIEVLDGWTFQVSLIFTDQITGPHIFAYSVLIRVSTRIPRNDRMSNIDLFIIIRSHVYFKNDKMHGKFFFLGPGALNFTFDPVTRPGQTFGRPLSFDHWYVFQS